MPLDMARQYLIDVVNPNPPPRKDRSDDSARTDHHSSISSSSGKSSSETARLQSPSGTEPSSGTSSHTYANPANPLRFLYL